MQNRYVADIGDYVKLAILRRLAPDRSLGVAWWLFPDEHHNADGDHREYLERPKSWKHFDPNLFDVLLKIEKEGKRHVHAIEKSGVLPNAIFTSDHIPCEAEPFSLRREERSIWIKGIKSKLKDCNLLFLDPDNGVASEGLRLTQRRAGKSVTIEEVEALQGDSRAMVVYHHQTRRQGGHLNEIDSLALGLRERGLHVSGALRAKPWSPRVFFILNGDQELLDRAKNIAEIWGNWISWIPLSKS